jgi:uncharacterized OB-fold protein
MNLNKICPECETEYLPNMETCADCGEKLLLYEEYRNHQEQRRRLAEQAVSDSVVVRKGDPKWIDELRNVLINSGIPCAIDTEDGCNKRCCGGEWRLMVDKEDLEKAQSRIEDYFREIHPEAKVSSDLESQGKCPACGYSLSPDAEECPDCGLQFVIDEEEDEESNER